MRTHRWPLTMETREAKRAAKNANRTALWKALGLDPVKAPCKDCGLVFLEPDTLWPGRATCDQCTVVLPWTDVDWTQVPAVRVHVPQTL